MIRRVKSGPGFFARVFACQSLRPLQARINRAAGKSYSISKDASETAVQCGRRGRQTRSMVSLVETPCTSAKSPD